VEILLPHGYAVVCFVALPIQQCSLRCLGPTEFFKGFNKTQHSRHKGKDKTNKHANCWCALRLSRFFPKAAFATLSLLASFMNATKQCARGVLLALQRPGNLL
jgi:hypothetical protein